jgi:hypothetical protein
MAGPRPCLASVSNVIQRGQIVFVRLPFDVSPSHGGRRDLQTCCNIPAEKERITPPFIEYWRCQQRRTRLLQITREGPAAEIEVPRDDGRRDVSVRETLNIFGWHQLRTTVPISGRSAKAASCHEGPNYSRFHSQDGCRLSVIEEALRSHIDARNRPVLAQVAR